MRKGTTLKPKAERVERLMASLIHVRPYRCASCDRRFYSKQSRPAQSAR